MLKGSFSATEEPQKEKGDRNGILFYCTTFKKGITTTTKK